MEPGRITQERERAQRGAGLPQALQARRQPLRDVLAQLERQQARLLDVSLAEVIEREECERKRQEVAQTQHGLRQQLRQRDAQAQHHVNVVALAQGIETFCQRLPPTLDTLTFAQRRPLVEWLIDGVIVNDTQVEIRYVVPTGPTGETTPFCHLRLDYFDLETRGVAFYQFTTVQLRVSRTQYDETRLGRVFLVEEDHDTQATLQRLVPHHGGIQVQMRFIFPGAEVLETAPGLEVDLPVILAPCPTSLRVRTGGEQHAVGVAPQFGDRVQIEADDCIKIFLLRIDLLYAPLRFRYYTIISIASNKHPVSRGHCQEAKIG
jgi:hypothetical protein